MEVQAPPICHPSSQAAPELPSQGGRAVDSDKGTGRLGHPGPSLGHRPLFCRIGRLFFASTIETPDPTTITHSIATSSSPLPSLASIHARSLAGGLLLQQLSRREAPPPRPPPPPLRYSLVPRWRPGGPCCRVLGQSHALVCPQVHGSGGKSTTCGAMASAFLVCCTVPTELTAVPCRYTLPPGFWCPARRT